VVDGQVAYHGEQPGLRAFERQVIGLQRAQVGVLHRILGVRRSEQARGRTQQAAAVSVDEGKQGVFVHRGMLPQRTRGGGQRGVT
jgi:hypothetical protein